MEFRGRKLRDLREGKGESINDLAKILCRTRPAITMWETGAATPTVGMLCRLCDHYGIKPNYFFD